MFAHPQEMSLKVQVSQVTQFNFNSSSVIQTHHDELLPQLVDDFLVSSSQRDSIKHGQAAKR